MKKLAFNFLLSSYLGLMAKPATRSQIRAENKGRTQKTSQSINYRCFIVRAENNFWENNLSSSSATTTCVTHFWPRRGKDSECSMIRRDFSLTNKCLSLHTRKSRDTCRAVCIGSIIYSSYQEQTLRSGLGSSKNCAAEHSDRCAIIRH